MNWKRTESEFDGFAKTYEWIFGEEKTKTPLTDACQSIIDRTKPLTILDCACGPGWSSIALKKAGYSVHGSDISGEMIKLARANARKAGIRVPFTVSAWHDLPSKISRKFDLVMCEGNAIGHCPDKPAMADSLQCMRALTDDGGHVYIDTRSWEWFRSNTRRVWPAGSLDDEEGHHIIIQVATVPRRWAQPHVIEVVHINERPDALTVDSYPVTFYAFRIEQLFECLRVAGYDNIETDYEKGRARYYVVARAV